MDFENALISGNIDLLKRKNTNDNILEVINFKIGRLFHTFALFSTLSLEFFAWESSYFDDSFDLISSLNPILKASRL